MSEFRRLSNCEANLEVRVTKTEEVLHRIPAEFCDRLFYVPIPGSRYDVYSIKKALKAMKDAETRVPAKIEEPATQPKQFIIEGVDRMGKSTLINGLLNELGYHLVVHYEKPKALAHYASHEKSWQLCQYQMALYNQMFRLIQSRENIIFDRGHLGELVYAPMYRKYDPFFVKQMEDVTDTSSARLVLLMTSDFSFIQDDGNSLDFSKKEEEQAKFIAEFNASCIKDKVLVDVSNGQGGYRSAESILKEVLKR